MDVSVICPVFNTPPAILYDAARSVLGDECSVAELILVDDASNNPDTLAACQALRESDCRVVLIRLPRNVGPASARNAGLRAARGDWIGFLDSDDIWLPGRIAAARAVLGRNPTAAWIGGGHGRIGPGETWQPATFLSTRLGRGTTVSGGTVPLEGPALTRLFIADFCMHLGAMIARRDLLLRAGGFAEGLRRCEDFLLQSKLSVLAPLHYLPQYLYGWRSEHASLISSPERLAGRSMRMHRVAAADPLLHAFRRELRRASYSARKGLALNNLLAGRRAPALAFALGAFCMAPREARDLGVFLGLWLRSRAAAMRGGARYSHAERFLAGTGA